MKLLDRILLTSISVSCLFINFIGYDIFNTTRLVSLLFFGTICLSILLLGASSGVLENNKVVLIVSFLIVFSVLLSLIFSGISLFEGSVGVYGRNTGAITYISLVIFLVSAYFSKPISRSESLLLVIIAIGTISAVYGIIQIFNMDPLLTNNPYNPIRGFFGNPNFHSAFLGISFIAAFAMLISNEFALGKKTILLFVLIVHTIVIIATASKQGLIIAIFGSVFVLAIKFWTIENLKPLSKLIFLLIPISVLLTTLDLLRIGPWKSFIYEPSVSYRGDFWRAGIAMFIDNPVFGVGPDGYRDQFRFYRDEVSANRLEISPPINSAHNIFIELAASGGTSLLLGFVLLLLIVSTSIFKLIKNLKNYNYSIAGIIGCWLGFAIQALISVNTIPLSLVGWILMGKLLNARRNNQADFKLKNKNNIITKLSLLPLVALVSIGLPLINNDVNFKRALETQNVEQIRAAAYKFPKDVYRMSLIAEIFRRSNMPEIGIQIARDAVELSPNNYEALEELYLMPNISKNEKAKILNRLKLMDPLNKDLFITPDMHLNQG